MIVSGVSTFTGAADFNDDIDVDGHTELDNLNVSGVSTFAGAADFNGDLDVDGHTELDQLRVSGISTFNNNVSLGGTSGVSNITGLSRLELYDSAANVVIGNNDTADSIDFNLIKTVENVFVGLGAGQNFQQGNGNNIIGYYAGQQGTVGGSDYSYFNNIIGYQAARNLTSGSYNQAIGQGSLENLTSGDRNIAIGNYPGFVVTTGDHNILLGDSADVTNGSDSYNIVIGKDITVNGNNNLAIGINGEKLITGVKDGAVELYYNNSKKFETTAIGATVYGTLDTERLNVASVADKTTIVDGNNITLSYDTGGGNVAICTNPSGPITLNIVDIPTTSNFDNRAISFAVIVQQGTTAYGCTAATLNGVAFDSAYTVGTGTHISYPGGTVAVGNTSGYDVFNFTGINTVGSASTVDNYKLLSNLNGDYRLWS